MTDDKDWTFQANELFRRREDGLCRDFTLGRKSMIPGDPAAVLQSMNTIATPAPTPPSIAKDKHDGVQAIAGDTARINEGDRSLRGTPEVFQRSEYTWEDLVRQSSSVKITRSQTFHHDLPENRTPRKPNGTTRSLNFDREGKPEMGRSKSLRGYRDRGLLSSHAVSAGESLPVTGIVISVERGDKIKKRENLERRPQDKRSDTITVNALAKEGANASVKENKRRVSRSGSAPSVRAKETVVKRDAEDPPRQRSISLRWIPEPDYQSVSIEELAKSGDKTIKRENLEKSSQQQRPVTCEGSANAIAGKKAKAIDENKQNSKSGSVPSTQDLKREPEVLPTERGVSIPEPDYQTVSIEDLVTATQNRNKGSNENNVCVVEIHNAPKSVLEVSKPIGNDDTNDVPQETVVTPNSSSQKPSSSSDHFSSKFPVPGVARRVPTEIVTSSDQGPEQIDGTVIEIKGTNVETLSVKNRIQNLECQTPSARPNSSPNQSTPTKTSLVVDGAANLAPSSSNSNSKPKVLTTNEQPAVNDNNDKSQVDLLSSRTKQSQVRSIGKMKIIKNDEIPAWLQQQERPLKRPIKENQSSSLEKTPSTEMSQSTDQIPTGHVTVLHNRTEAQRQTTSELVRAALAKRSKSNNDNSSDENNNIINKTMPTPNTGRFEEAPADVKVTILPNEDVSSPTDHSANEPERSTPITKHEDTGPSLEEKKRNWKREQIVDQLHSARNRNVNQNYIFGTGLAYQSCMPELQNKLKQLTLAK